MFDIGFPELILVSIVALLVIGPDKLPETVRTIVLWVGRFKRSLANIRMEIENEIGADEIRQQLHNESILKELDEAKAQLKGVLNDTEASLNSIKDSANIMSSVKPKTTSSETISGSTSSGSTSSELTSSESTTPTASNDSDRSNSKPG